VLTEVAVETLDDDDDDVDDEEDDDDDSEDEEDEDEDAEEIESSAIGRWSSLIHGRSISICDGCDGSARPRRARPCDRLPTALPLRSADWHVSVSMRSPPPLPLGVPTALNPLAAAGRG
jgi:hypothetical protein